MSTESGVDSSSSIEPGAPIRLGITIGDPGGIGPEVIVKALQSWPHRKFEAVLFGSQAVMEFEDYRRAGGLEIIEVAAELSWDERPVGYTGRAGAILQKRALQYAMKAAEKGEIDAIVTAPWNKALFQAAGEPVVGHTEVLARYFGVEDVVMMLAGSRLRVVLVTTHIPLAEVAKSLDTQQIATTIEVAAGDLQTRFGVDEPRFAVCGLNPHAGEQGHMGREEIEIIEPAIAEARAELGPAGITIEGPYPSDTLFAKFRDQRPHDAVVCMYHDQGLIPLKLLHFGESANITLGLPVIRTSVDHGTAYDIAGRGVADAGSMRYALQTAISMVQRSRERR